MQLEFSIYEMEGLIEYENDIIRNLFICENKKQKIAKTSISNKFIKNYSILLDDIQRIDEEYEFKQIYFVGETFFNIDEDSLNEFKTKCEEIYTVKTEYFNLENISKSFLKN